MTRREDYRYLTRIILFVNRRYGMDFFISPRDFDVLMRWREKNIPLPVIREAVRQVVERWKKQGKTIRSFANFNYQVKKEFSRMSDLQLGRRVREVKGAGSGIPGAESELHKYLDRCPQELMDLKPGLERIGERMKNRRLTPEDVDRFYRQLLRRFEEDPDLILQTRKFLTRLAPSFDRKEMERQFKINYLLNRFAIPFLEEFEH